MNPADIRALLAVLLRGQDASLIVQQEAENVMTLGTHDAYLGLAQQILESSWNPNNYKHPAGEETPKQGVSEAIQLLKAEGYGVRAPEGWDL